MTQYLFTHGEMNFIPAGVRAPKAYNNPGAQDPERNFVFDTHDVRIVSGRVDEEIYSLDRQGFQFVREPTALSAVRLDDDPSIEAVYYPEVTDLLRGATGADEVLIFDHTIRIAGNTEGRKPVRSVHVDYTPTSGPQRLTDLLGEEEARRWLDGGRVAQVNLWRPLGGTVLSLPLALVDAQTVRPTDLRRQELVYSDRVGEIYGVSFNPNYRWTYFPHMTQDEAILIKGWDSAEDGRARFTPHSGFDDPSSPDDAPPRHSIEVRTFLRFRDKE